MKILVIGGGMSGLTYAIVASSNGHDVTVAERNPRVGKKISMTGNGKCNIGNADVSPACYNDSAIVKKVLDAISVDEYRRFLTSCGIYTYQDAEGRMYPLSDNANSVVDCLRFRLSRLGGTILLDTTVQSYRKTDKGYQVVLNGKTYLFDKVVLCCGSGSQAETPDLKGIVPQEYFTPLSPSLVPVKVTKIDGILNGIRAKADVTLLADNKAIATQSGEVLFKDYGLSGICIFNLSAIIARRTVQQKKANYAFSIDLVPSIPLDTLVEILTARSKSGDKTTLFVGLLHNKLAESVLKNAPDHSPYTLAKTAKNMLFRYEKLLDWSKSQVTAGGIDQKYVDIDTLTLEDGLVVLGEVLDVDGLCGGNNLFFASASALYTFSADERRVAYDVAW